MPMTPRLGGGLDRIAARRLVRHRDRVHRSGERRERTEETRLVLGVEHADHEVQRPPPGAVQARRQRLAGGRIVAAVQPQLAACRQARDERSPRQPLQAPGPFDRAQALCERPRVRGEVAERQRARDRQAGIVDLMTARERRQRQVQAASPTVTASRSPTWRACQSRPCTLSGAPTARARCSITAQRLGGCGPTMQGTPAFRMPAFSNAICSRRSPRNAW